MNQPKVQKPVPKVNMNKMPFVMPRNFVLFTPSLQEVPISSVQFLFELDDGWPESADEHVTLEVL